MATADPAPTASLTPDPLLLCRHIRRLNGELRIARRLLKLAIEERQKGEVAGTPSKGRQEVTNASR